MPLLIKALSLFEKRKRFVIALHATKFISPLFRFISASSPISLGSYREDLLARVINSMTLRKLDFDPVLIAQGAEFAQGKGAILITGHFYLNFLVSRWFHDQKRKASLVARLESNKWKIPGTDVPINIIRPDETSLLNIKTRIRAGEFVGIALDHSTEIPAEGIRYVNVGQRNIYVSDAIFHFAERARIPVYFFNTRIVKEQVMIKFVCPSSSKADIVFEEFCEFLSLEIKE